MSDGEEARRGRGGAILAAIGLLLATLLFCLRKLDDWDLPWHLATGRVIARTHAIPRVDDLAFTHGTVKYVEALSDLGLYLTVHLAGPVGLQIVNGLFSAATIYVLHRLTRRSGPFAYLVIAVAVIAIAPWQYTRPATMSLLFIALVMLALEEHRETDRDRALYLLVPLQLIWANVHGYAPLGLLIFGIHLVDRALARKPIGRPLLVLLAATVATSISSAGPRLLVMVKRFDEDLTDITEWARPTLRMLWAQSPAIYLLLALLVAAILISAETERPRRVYDLGVVALAIALFVSAIRFVPVMVVMTTPFIARRLGRLVRPSNTMATACGFATVLASVILALTLEPLLGLGWYLPYFPEGATKFIEARKPAGNMWNFMPFGGWLAWRLHPTYRVFNDGRNALARDRSLVTRGRLSMADPVVFAGLVAELDMQWAVTCTIRDLCTSGDGFNRPLTADRRFRMVFLDDVGAVYARIDGPNAPLAASGYRVIDHLTNAKAMLDLATNGAAKPSDLAHDGLLAVEQDPNSVRALTLEAIGALATRDEPLFRAALTKVQQLAPESDVVPTLTAAWRR